MKKFNLNYLRKIFGIGILLCASINSYSQNYIGNGSFEYVTICPNRPGGSGVGTDVFSQNKFPADWYQPTNGSTDLHNNCPTTYDITNNPTGPWVWTNDNFAGCQTPQNGSNYIGFYTSGSDLYNGDYREMIQCTLSTSLAPNGLVAGQCYTLEFWVSLGDRSEYATPIQINFSGGAAPPRNYDAVNGYYGTMNLVPQLTTPVITNATGWEHITFQYTALGGEKYMTMGFFEGESSSNIVAVTAQNPAVCNVSHPINERAYYYIDNVSLTISGGLFTPTAGYIFSNTTLNNVNWNGIDALLDGNITLTGTNQMTDCNVRCTKTCKITFAGTASLTTSGTTFSTGCDHMWEGMDLGASSYGLFMTGGTGSGGIQDAVTAINNPNGRPLQLSDNLLFKGNVTDIIEDNTGTIVNGQGSFIRGTTFDHSAFLKEPSYGVNHLGIMAIKILGQTGANNLAIGGPNLADVCSFLGGQYGIQSNNANVTVERCLFSNIKQVAIDFEGNHPNYALRTLTVKGASTFVSNKRAILSQHKTNLTVQGCYFYYAQEHAIEWDDNHDGHLLIGDTADAMKGNSFQDNAWTCVTAWNNKTAQTDPELLATNNNGLSSYTSIVIANNMITAPAAAGGFLIGEWTLGSTVPYHTLDVSLNTMNNVIKGIQMYNIRGWGGVFSSTNTPSNLPAQHVWSNTIGITTAVTASPFGIKIGNAPGYSVQVNEITSDAPGTWQNIGIEFESSPYSKIFLNTLRAGNGIAVRQDMLNSDIHCNTIYENATGIFLDGTTLRAVNDYHGRLDDGFYNNISSTNPWQHEIFVLNCDLTKNQWIWTADPLPSVSYYNSPGTLFQTVTGDNNCDIPIYRYPYVQNGPNIDMSFSGANEQWKADYNYEITRLHTDSGSSAVASANIKSIIAIEDHIGAKNYTAAQTALTALTPANAFEENFKEVMTVFVALNYPQQREPATGEMITLTDIAAQYSRNAGPAVTLARTYLAVKYNMYFADEVPFLDTTVHGTTVVSSPCSIAPMSGTQLSFMDNHGLDLPMYATIEANGNFAFDPGQLNYYRNPDAGTLYRIYATRGSKFTVVSQDFKTLTDWIAEGSIYLDLAGASVEIDTVTAEEYEGIDHYTSVEDKEGNVYSVGVTSGANTDFLIEKRTSGNDLSWSRTYDGPTAGSDTATCITIDGENNIYVAGKVFNGMSYDYQVLKYNPDGVLIWESYLADSLKKNNTPTGISIHGSGSVSITGTCINDTSSEFRFVKLWQCLPFAERIGNANEETETIQTSSVEFYPNPATGKITIALGDQSGGTLELFSLEGRLIFTKQISQPGEVVFPESQVANGVYLLKFSGSGQPQFSKLIIQHNQ